MSISLKQKLAGFALAAGMFTSLACSTSTSANAPQPPPDVEVATVEQRDVPIYREWIGTLDGMVNAAIKAEVTGYLLSQNYIEGSFVRKGQLLFEIDPRPFDAALAQAQGQLSQAKGQLAQAQGTTGTGTSPSCASGRESRKNPTGRRQVHTARQRAGGHTAGPGQCRPKQQSRQGADRSFEGQCRNGKGAD